MLISEAQDNVSSASYSPRRLTLIHAGITAAATLLISLLSYGLDLGIGEAGGLSGIGTRAALETAQAVMQMLLNMLSPFWALGFTAAALQYARRYSPRPGTLLTGFRLWAPALRLMILQGLMYFAAGMLALQVGSFLYMLTPASDVLTQLVEKTTAGGNADPVALQNALAQMDISAVTRLVLGFLPFLLVPILLVAIFLSYRLRFANYLLMTMPRPAAFMSVALSMKMTKKNCLAIFKLDLRFWWFYVLELLAVVLCYGDVVLDLFGIHPEGNAIFLSFLFFALGLAGQVALYVWKKPLVDTASALLFTKMLPSEAEESAI